MGRSPEAWHDACSASPHPPEDAVIDMTGRTFLLWIGVGLVAGWLVPTATEGAREPLSDLAVGVLGACLGGLLFQNLGIERALFGLPSTFFVAFVGAVALLLLLRLIRRGVAR